MSRNLDNLDQAVADFLAASPNPSDEAFHSWAEGQGHDTHQAEAAAYRLASAHAKFLADGKAGEKGVGPADVSGAELGKGVEVEHEHTPDPATAKRIATDHLAEIPDYYQRLDKMESQAKKEKGSMDKVAFLMGYSGFTKVAADDVIEEKAPDKPTASKAPGTAEKREFRAQSPKMQAVAKKPVGKVPGVMGTVGKIPGPLALGAKASEAVAGPQSLNLPPPTAGERNAFAAPARQMSEAAPIIQHQQPPGLATPDWAVNPIAKYLKSLAPPRQPMNLPPRQDPLGNQVTAF